eukprot:5248248-Prymnesium_polylepis.1
MSHAEYFGEGKLLFDDPYSGATYTAGQNGCSLLAFPRAAFTDIFENDPNLFAGVRIKLLRSGCGLGELLGNMRSRMRLYSFLQRKSAEEKRGVDVSNGLRFFQAATQFAQLEKLELRAACRSVAQSIFFTYLSNSSRLFVGREVDEGKRMAILQ